MSAYPRYTDYRDSGVDWLGEVPAQWKLKPLLASFEQRREKNAGMLNDNLLSLSYGSIIQKDIGTSDGLLPESFETYQIVHQGDIVCRLTDLQNDKRSLRTARVGEKGIITSAYLCLKPTSIDSKFAHYLLRAIDERKVLYSLGSGLRQSLKYSDLSRLPLPLPDLCEQKQIAGFLEQETKRIDRLIVAQKRLIAGLQEKRQAVISHAVTKGLNPDAPMKPSGVEWLGEVPAHWEVVAFQRLTTIAEGQVDPRESPFSEMILIAPNHVESGTGRLLYTETAEQQGAISGKYICPPNSVIYSKIRPALRKVCLSAERVLCSADMYPIACEDGLLPEFLYCWMQTENFSAFAELESDRVAMPKINRESLKKVRIPVPPMAEQREICAQIANEIAELDRLRAEALSMINVIGERRSSLISAAVTGKIDVRNRSSSKAVA